MSENNRAAGIILQLFFRQLTHEEWKLSFLYHDFNFHWKTVKMYFSLNQTFSHIYATRFEQEHYSTSLYYCILFFFSYIYFCVHMLPYVLLCVQSKLFKLVGLMRLFESEDSAVHHILQLWLYFLINCSEYKSGKTVSPSFQGDVIRQTVRRQFSSQLQWADKT